MSGADCFSRVAKFFYVSSQKILTVVGNTADLGELVEIGVLHVQIHEHQPVVNPLDVNL
jgi:hypothetical protein